VLASFPTYDDFIVSPKYGMAIRKKQAIKQGNKEGAQIHAQDAIREKNQALNCLKMASRIDAVSSRLETAVRMNNLSTSMAGVVRGMSTGLQSMDVDKMAATMDKFESQFEDLDVRTQYMDDAMNSTTASTTPADQVDTLIQIVADENQLELGEAFNDVGPVGKKVPQPSVAEASKTTDDLEARLANLRS